MAVQRPVHAPGRFPQPRTLLAARHDFFPGDTRQSVLDAMSKAQTDKLAEIWAAHDPAIEDVIKTGPHTPDLGGKASTTQLGEAIAARI